MKAGSPDSMPSLAESQSSADGDDVLLFATRAVRHGAGLTRTANSYATDMSVASIYLDDEENSILGGSVHASSAQNALTALSHPELSYPLEQSDPEEIPPQATCHAGLNMSPKQLAHMFNIFDTSKRDGQESVQEEMSLTTVPTYLEEDLDCASDAVTTVTSNTVLTWERKTDSLEHEVTTLKEIIKADSARIVQLKSELENLRSSRSSTASMVVTYRTDLAACKRENQLLYERESQHFETIEALKSEVNRLTKQKKDVSPLSQKAIQQLRLENELFASQIIENEQEMREVNSAAKLLKQENTTMRRELNHLQTLIRRKTVAQPMLEESKGEASTADSNFMRSNTVARSLLQESKDELMTVDSKSLLQESKDELMTVDSKLDGFIRSQTAVKNMLQESKDDDASVSTVESQLAGLAARLVQMELEREKAALSLQEESQRREQGFEAIRVMIEDKLSRSVVVSVESHNGVDRDVDNSEESSAGTPDGKGSQSKLTEGKAKASNISNEGWNGICDCFAPSNAAVV